MTESFVTAVLCIDGRFRRCLVEWVTAHFGIDYVDLVTEPGPDRVLAEDSFGPQAEGVRSRLEVSRTAHQPAAIVIAGHDDCAGNPVDQGIHRIQERRAVTVLQQWYPDLPILGLHVDTECAIHLIADNGEG